MKYRTLFPAILAGFLAGYSALAQSPNLKESGIRLNATDFQTRSEKGAASGYAPLDGNTLVAPQFLFPNFTSGGIPQGTVWVKGPSNTLVPVSGVTLGSTSLTLGNVVVGDIGSSLFGIKIASGASPLFIKAGSGNRVYIDYQQSVGGANSARNDYTWFVGPNGNFKFANGEFNGALDFNGFNVTEAAQIAGSGLTINYGTGTITVPSGNLTVTTAGGNGLVIPSSGSQANATFALNATAANLLYARLNANNTLSGTNTFTIAPVVPDNSFAIGKVNGLQTALDARLKLDGSATMTAALNFGGFKATNLANPTQAQDGVTLGYLQANYPSSAVTNLTVQNGTPINLTGPTGAVVISMPVASGSANGYLSSTNWSTFNNKENLLTFNAPINRSGNTITLPQATSLANGYLTSGDWSVFNGKENALTFTAPLSRATNTVSLPKATALVDGYLSAADFVAFSGNSFVGFSNGDLWIGNSTISGGGATKAKITSSDGSVTIVNGPGSIDLKLPTGFLDGQILIGNSGTGSVQKGYILAGAGISVTNGAGGITITNTAGSTPSSPAVVSTKTSSTTFSNSSADNTYHTYNTIANQLTANSVIRVRVFGTYSYTASSQNFTVNFKVGGVTISSVATPVSTATETTQPWSAECVFTMRSAGATATVQAFQRNEVYSGTPPGQQTAATTNTTTVDTTVISTISVTAQQNSAVSGRQVTVDQAFIEIN